MIYITQMIFVKDGKEEVFHEFEDLAIPLMEKYSGRIIYRLRPTKGTYITSSEEEPYEIHFMSFDSDTDLNNFMRDDERLKFIHLKDESIKSVFLVKGQKM